jgi:hypothetical protein
LLTQTHWMVEVGGDSLDLVWLSDAARGRLLVGDELWVPWGLVLTLLAMVDQEQDQVQALRARLPGWVAPEDEEVLTDLLTRAQLPPKTPYCLHVKATGTAGRPGYGLVTRWVTPQHQALLGEVGVEGGLMWDAAHPEAKARLTLGQWSVLEALHKAGAGGWGVERGADLLATDHVLAAVPPGDEGVIIDRFLAREQVVEASAVAPRLLAMGEGQFAVRAHIEGVPDDALDAYLSASPAQRLGEGVLAIREGAQRRRVVFGERAKAALADIKALRPLNTAQVARALSAPELFFGPNIDTSSLSERVVGLGVEVRTPSPKGREVVAGSQWLAGFGPATQFALSAYGDAMNPADDLDLDDPTTREALREAVDDAFLAGSRLIPHPTLKGVLIELTRALEDALLAAEARAAAAAAAASGDEREEEDVPDARTVLQILDNIETVNFAAPAPALEPAAATAAALQRIGRPPALAEGFELFPYQREGFGWLLQKSGALQEDPLAPAPVGALLADDMGLGKTLQVLSFLSQCVAVGRDQPHLVVAPIALLGNWQREAVRFFGDRCQPIAHITGADLPDDPAAAIAYLNSLRLVLVSYETLRRHELPFAQVTWQTVILDEAQKAKNPDTQIARVIRTLNARFRLAVTGTPVENSLTELWTLIDWLAPGLLGSLRDFNRDYILPLQDDYESGKRDLASQLQQIIRPIFLRRTKQEVLIDRLPPITVARHPVPLSDDQWQTYTHIAQHARASGRTLADLNRLFAVCAHPALHDDRLLLESLTADPFPKGEAFFKLLQEIADAHGKVLIFANRHRVQRWIADEIRRRFGFTPAIINGALTGSERRVQLVDTFNESPKPFDALILAPRAAGMGLNITGANHVIHYMREWNPAVENQATDRAYRIGQTRPVTVHLLIATNPPERPPTVEQILDQLLEAKRQLMSDFIIPMGRADLEHQDIWQAVSEPAP